MFENSRNLSNVLLTAQFQPKLTNHDIAVGISIIIATLGGVFYKIPLMQQISSR
ncbi:MAG: hypothetical protein ACI9R8_002258 [Candidatus Paceibacteria bacterium]|jgi:hypothetical protein